MKKKRKQSSLKHFLSSTLAGIIFAGLFSCGVFVFATPPTSQYAPGDTLNPSCTVGSANCSTVFPVPYTGASAALDLGAQNFLTTGTSALGASTSFKYDSSNYTTLTTASNGDLTIATATGTTGGNININSAVTGDFTILSNSGTLVLGGTGNTNNESIKLDFETYSNKVAVTSATGVTDLDLGSLNLTTTGILTLGGSTTGTLMTRVKAGAATESDTNGSLVVDSSNGRLYFRYGSAWHYVAQTAGFQIPDFETIDPISGDEIKEGDLVLGMVNHTFEDKALHGVWVKWDSVKEELIKELQGQTNTLSFSSPAAPTSIETMLQKVTNVLFSLGISVKDGLVNITNLVAEKITVKTARIEKLEMIDKGTGDIYCTWMENGDWQKAKGECGSVQVAQALPLQMQQQAIDSQNIADQVKQDLAPQIQSQVEAQVQEEVQNQLEAQTPPPALESAKEPVQELIKEPVLESAPEQITPSVEIEFIAPTSSVIDVLVQDAAAALMDKAKQFFAWLATSLLPVVPKNVSFTVPRPEDIMVAIGENAQRNNQIMAGIFSKLTASVISPLSWISSK